VSRDPVSRDPVSRTRLIWACLLVGHLVLSFYFVDARRSANPLVRAATVVALYDYGNLQIDPLASKTADKAEINGHAYSDKAPLGSALAAAAFSVVQPFLDLPPKGSLPRWWVAMEPVMAIGGLLCGSLPFFLLLLLGFDATRRLPAHRAAWLVPLAIYGGFLHIYAGVFTGHLLGALWLVLAYRFLFERARPFAAGLCLGLAFLTEYPLALALPLWIAQRFTRLRSHREISRVLLGFLPGALLVGVHNAVVTGSPFTFPSKFNSTEAFAGLTRGYGLALPSWESIWGLTFSSFRGVFFYAPVALVLLVLLVQRCTKLRGGNDEQSTRPFALRLLTDGALGFFAVSMVYFMSRPTEPSPLWSGGHCYGPRYLIPATALLLYAGLRKLDLRDHRAALLVGLTGAIGVVCAWSASVTTGYLASKTGEPNPLIEQILPSLLANGPDLRSSVLAQRGLLRPETANVLWLGLFVVTVVGSALALRVVSRPASRPSPSHRSDRREDRGKRGVSRSRDSS